MYHHFIHPFSMIIAGPSMSGKSTFVKKLLENKGKMFDVEYEKILWCFAENSAKPDIEGVIFVKGLPKSFENEKYSNTLIVLDDLMNDAYNADVSELFTKGVHHRNCSVILITQNIFHKSSHSRTINLNAKYLVLLKNPRDKLQFAFLSRQIYPENHKELLRVYNEVMQTPHAYLIIDLSQSCSEFLRFKTNIFESDYLALCYANLDNNVEVESETIGKESVYVIRT